MPGSSMRMVAAVVLCVALVPVAAVAAGSKPTGSFKQLANVRGTPWTLVDQARTPDDGVLSMKFSSLLLGVPDGASGTRGTSVQVRAPVAAGTKTRVTAELHGGVAITGKAQCRVVLSDGKSTSSAVMKKSRDFSTRLKLSVVPDSDELVLDASLDCEGQPGSAVKGAIESLELTWAGAKK